MTAAFLTQVAHVGDRDDQDQAHEARESLAAMLAWMTASIVSRSDARSFSFGSSGSSATAESWRGPAGGLTQTSAAPGDAAPSDGRVVAEVKTEALGAIRLVVERTSSGVSVVIGVRQAASFDLAESHRAALEQALVSAGLTVASVVFTRVAEDGTDLALEGHGSSDATSDASDAGAAGNAGARPSAKRRLNTVG